MYHSYTKLYVFFPFNIPPTSPNEDSELFRMGSRLGESAPSGQVERDARRPGLFGSFLGIPPQETHQVGIQMIEFLKMKTPGIQMGGNVVTVQATFQATLWLYSASRCPCLTASCWGSHVPPEPEDGHHLHRPHISSDATCWRFRLL